jgi:hypothetical protein
MIQTLLQYKKELLKINLPRQTKDTKTYYSKYLIRSIKKKYNINVKEDEYSKIIRRINELLSDTLLQGSIIKFPYNMGSLCIYSNSKKLYMKDNKLINTSTVDWTKTIELWYNDEKARNKKSLVKRHNSTIYKVVYSTTSRGYRNRQYYSFRTSRNLKLKINNYINNNINIPCYERTLYNN